MTATHMRTLAIATLFALLAGVIGVASLASAATGGPSVALTSSATASSTNAAIDVTATFSSDVTGLASTSVDTTNATVSNFSGSGTTYTFTVTPTADGAVMVSIPADAAMDASSTGNVASNVLSFNYDATAPTISNVSVSGIGNSGATVTWTTSEPTTGQINYGTTTGLGSSTTVESTASTTHSAMISGLNASTTYTYQVSVTDAAGNTATTSLATFDTTAVATPAPAISNISVTSNGTSTATITWDTDQAATGFVSYGTTSGYGASTTVESMASTTHSVTLNNLNEATQYHFQISESTNGGTSTSSDQTFFTQSTGSTTPLAVTGVDAVRSSASADNQYSDGWEWVLHVTVPDNENAFRIRFSDWGNASSSFATANNMRIYSTQSSNASTADNAISETSNGYSDWIYLNGDASSSTAGRQVDLVVDVKIPFGTANGSYTTTYTAQSYPSTATSTATQ